MRVFPNPSSGVIQVAFEQEIHKKVSFTLLNSLGQVCQSGILSEQANRIELENLSSGIYFLNLAGFDPIKIVKQ